MNGKLLLWAPLALLAMLNPSNAQTLEEFYKGKTIKLLVGVDAGQRDDTWARLFIKPMAKRIPGNPNIIVQNMPGARNIVANYINNVAPKDGTVFGHISGNLPVQMVTGGMKEDTDVRKFSWLGSVETTDQICLALATAPVKKAEDLFTTEMITAASFAGSLPVVIPTMLNNVLDMKFKLIRGYGGNETYLSLERNETQGTCTALGSFMEARGDWLKQGKVNILLHTGPGSMAALPDVPSVFKFTKNDQQRQVITFVTAGARIGRPFATAQGVPADRVAALRDALHGALSDPDFLADAKKLDFDPHYSTPEEVAQLVDAVYSTPKDLVAQAAQMLAGDK